MKPYRIPGERGPVIEPPLPKRPWFTIQDMNPGGSFLGIGLAQFLIAFTMNPEPRPARLALGAGFLGMGLGMTLLNRYLRIRRWG